MGPAASRRVAQRYRRDSTALEGETGFLVRQHPAAVEKPLRRLLEDSQLRERLGAAGRRHASTARWAENASAVRAIYETVLT